MTQTAEQADRNKQIQEELENAINWENWENDEATEEAGETQYMKVREVIHSRLDWIRDQLKAGKPLDEEELEEALDTIDMTQKALETLTF